MNKPRVPSATPLALQKIREELQRIPVHEPLRLGHHWIMIPQEMDDLMAHALIYLCESLQVERATVFSYDDRTQTLLARQQVDHGDVMTGEEEIALPSGSPLARMLTGKPDYLVLPKPMNAVYIPLRAFGYTFGVLRVESLQAGKLTPAVIPLLKDFAHELATPLRGLEMAVAERQQVARMQTLHEVSNAIFRSLRLEEMLLSVGQSLIHQMGFDRTKFYLINKEGDTLEAALTIDQRGRQELLDKEQYPLKRGVHPMVDLLLGKTDDERLEKYQQTIIYLPLRTRDENMGILMVDNLLSQQEISPEETRILEGIAGQVGMAVKNARLFQGVEELSITDGLTGLYLLRYFKQRLKEEFYRAERTHGQLSLMTLDIDHFKRYNDTYGHPAGDTILSTVAERVLSNARKVDLTARYGGDEFVILLPDTSAEEAMLLADRLHQAVSNEPISLPDGTTVNLTVSIGVATYPTHATNSDELIKRSDEALYWIKSHGRNRTHLYSIEE